MPPPPFDPRVTPARPDLAAESLRGKVEAARFVAGEAFRIVAPIAPLRRAPDSEAPLETEALYGEAVVVYEERGDWRWVQLARDGYVGYLPAAALGPARAPTHKVAALRTHAYPGADASSGRRASRCRLARSSKSRASKAISPSPTTASASTPGISRRSTRASPISSPSPSVFSRRPICGAGAPARGSTAPAWRRPR